MDTNKLENFRKEIDIIDDEILILFSRRMEISQKISLEKKNSNLPILNSRREDYILSKIEILLPHHLVSYAKELYNTIFKISKDYQNYFHE